MLNEFAKRVVIVGFLFYVASGFRANAADLITDLALGDFHTCALKASGHVACWGSNTAGQLGPVSLDSDFTAAPRQLHGVQNVVAFAAGGRDTCVVFQDGGVMCFGAFSTRSVPSKRVEGIHDAVDVAVGRGHACILRSNRQVSCWGDNTYGQLGLGNNISTDTPTDVGLGNILEVKAGDYHTCARITSGNIFCWGLNSSGQLGNGLTNNHNVSREVLYERASSMSLGREHSCILTPAPSSVVRCWGDNASGLFGNGRFEGSVLIAEAGALGISVASQSAGGRHGCWVAEAYVLCAGSNDDGQLGIGSIDTAAISSPSYVRVSDLRILRDVAQVSAGMWHTCARKLSDGSVYCWGNNASGQLGTGIKTINPKIFATPVVRLDDEIFMDGFEHF